MQAGHAAIQMVRSPARQYEIASPMSMCRHCVYWLYRSASMRLMFHHPVGRSEVVEWMIAVSSALNYMHTNKPMVIHRDLKPANLIIIGDCTLPRRCCRDTVATALCRVNHCHVRSD